MPEENSIPPKQEIAKMYDSTHYVSDQIAEGPHRVCSEFRERAVLLTHANANLPRRETVKLIDDLLKAVEAKDQELYTAYLLGCEDECVPEPLTFEQFTERHNPSAATRETRGTPPPVEEKLAHYRELAKTREHVSHGDPEEMRQEDAAVFEAFQPSRERANAVSQPVAPPPATKLLNEWDLASLKLIAEHLRDEDDCDCPVHVQARSAEPVAPGAELSFGEDQTGTPSIFWTNPWNNEREAICKFTWPIHPPEVTEQVEQLWEAFGKAFAAVRIPTKSEAEIDAEFAGMATDEKYRRTAAKGELNERNDSVSQS